MTREPFREGPARPVPATAAGVGVTGVIGRIRAAPVGERLEFELTPADLEGLARAYLDRKADLDLRDLAIAIEQPAVVIRGVTALLGQDVTLTVRARPAVRERQFQIDLEDVRLNGTPAPRFAVREIAGFLQKKLTSPKLMVEAESLVVVDDGVRIVGRRRPDPAG